MSLCRRYSFDSDEIDDSTERTRSAKEFPELNNCVLFQSDLHIWVEGVVHMNRDTMRNISCPHMSIQ